MRLWLLRQVICRQFSSNLSSTSSKGTNKPKLRESHNPNSNIDILCGIQSVTNALLNTNRHPKRIFLDENMYHSWRQSTMTPDTPMFALLHLLHHSPALSSLPHALSTASNLSRLCGNLPHQGVCLETSSLPLPPLDESQVETFVLQHPNELLLYLAGVKDIMNFASILRASVYFGVRHVLLPHSHSCRPLPVVSRVSEGATERVEFHTLVQTLEVLQRLKENGVLLIATSEKREGWNIPVVEVEHLQNVPESRDLLQEARVSRRPVLLLMGSEDVGAPVEILQNCHLVLTLRSENSSLNCLNVSVACGIFLQHLKLSLVRDNISGTEPTVGS